MKYKVIHFLFLLFTCFPLNSLATVSFEAYLAEGDQFFEQGNFQQAAIQWENGLALLKEGEGAKQHIEVLIRLASAYQNLGMHRDVFVVLEQALSLSEQTQDYVQSATLLSQLSDAWLAIGDTEEALSLADDSVNDANETKEPLILAKSLNTLGNALSVSGYYDEALNAYYQSGELAYSANDTELGIKTSLNWINTALNLQETSKDIQSTETTNSQGILAKSVEELYDVTDRVEQLKDNHDKASYFITTGILALSIIDQNEAVQNDHRFAKHLKDQGEKALPEEIQLADELLEQKPLPESEIQAVRLHATQVFQKAAKIAYSLGDNRTMSIAKGRLGQLYEIAKKYDEAQTLTRQAIFYAQQEKHPDILYLWQWQQGRLFKIQNALDKAIAAYREAAKNLKPIQNILDVGYRNSIGTFDQLVRPVYYELAGLLLEKAELTQEVTLQQQLLKEARSTIEFIKLSELQDYFNDECVTALQQKVTELDQVDPHTAIVYPIALPDRIVLLLGLQQGIQQFIYRGVGVDELNDEVWQFRLALQTRPNNRFMIQGKKLYDWLIRPLEEQLTKHQVDTLVFAPDGKLRMIPFSTLNDGKQFLIEKYAVATTPGLTLTDPKKIDWKESKFLLVGLSDSVQGYPGLPSVLKEISSIKEITKARNPLTNKDYSIENLKERLKKEEFSGIHLATHGEFDSDPDYTYLLTYGEKMTMDKLQDVIGLGRFREKPIELLTLSACKTAVGDDRAALGLAGVAVKAGARSAIATLWFVDDEATSIAITEFYQQLLTTPGISKAKALQNAQKKLIAQARYSHPSYWGPFLLIGNWL